MNLIEKKKEKNSSLCDWSSKLLNQIIMGERAAHRDRRNASGKQNKLERVYFHCACIITSIKDFLLLWMIKKKSQQLIQRETN